MISKLINIETRFFRYIGLILTRDAGTRVFFDQIWGNPGYFLTRVSGDIR